MLGILYKYVFVFFFRLVVSLDTFYEDNNNSVHILLSGIDDNTVKQWHVNPDLKAIQSHKKLPIYSICWESMSPKLAIANTGDQIQILNDDKVRIETDRTNNPIKKITFSKCGRKIIYGTKNGDIVEFNLESKISRKLMTLHGNIKLLKYLNNGMSIPSYNIIVASADNGCLMVYANSQAIQLRSSTEVTQLRNLPIVPIIECFYLQNIDKLLTVEEKRSIKMWTIKTLKHEVLNGDMSYNDANTNVTMARMSNGDNMLAIVMNDSTFEIYNLEYTYDNLKTILYYSRSTDCPLHCCAFSYDNKYLALGGENGNIFVSTSFFSFFNLH